jgi:hypothetical protein
MTSLLFVDLWLQGREGQGKNTEGHGRARLLETFTGQVTKMLCPAGRDGQSGPGPTGTGTKIFLTGTGQWRRYWGGWRRVSKWRRSFSPILAKTYREIILKNQHGEQKKGLQLVPRLKIRSTPAFTPSRRNWDRHQNLFLNGTGTKTKMTGRAHVYLQASTHGFLFSTFYLLKNLSITSFTLFIIFIQEFSNFLRSLLNNC